MRSDKTCSYWGVPSKIKFFIHNLNPSKFRNSFIGEPSGVAAVHHNARAHLLRRQIG
ncbi:Uncharacterised protein [Mycobacteroides abscessus subsp. abscessus]|nr:Uncharacterised protein [Mycobacteroides abscessus subsp. abscessus]